MNVTPTIIRSTAAAYTVEQLQEKLSDALAKMGTGSVMTSVSTGGGTSYGRQVTATPEELVELYQRALDLKQGVTADDGVVQMNPVIFCNHGTL